MKNSRALTEVVSIALIVILVLILAIVIFALFMGSSVFQQKSAYLLPEFHDQTMYNKTLLVLFHGGGDAVYLNQTGQGQSQLGVYIDTLSGSYRVLPVAGLTAFKPGGTLYIYNTTAGYRMTANSSSLAPVTYNISACPLTIRLVDENAKLLIARWNYTCSLTGPAPTVTGINATPGYRGWTVAESITGTNFLRGISAKFNGSGLPDIPAASCTYVSPTRVNCSFSLLEKTAGTYNVVVTNPDGKRGMRAGAFVLSSPNPAIASSVPYNGSQATTVAITNLTGTNFQPGARVDYYLGGYRINLTSVTVVSRTQITGTLAIPGSAPAGSYGVNITNTDNKSGQAAGRFTVISSTPTITARTPSSGYRGWPVAMTISGTNFVTGATTRLNGTGYGDIAGTNVVVVSPTQITCTFDLKGATAGLWNLSVTNPDGRGAARANYFTVSSPAPTISSTTPATGYRGATVPVTLKGTYFQPGATVIYKNGTTSRTLTVSGDTVVNATTITLTLGIPSDAPAGTYNITVTNTDAKTATRSAAFRVYADATPSVTGITPVSGKRGTTVTPVVVTGTGFLPGARVRLYDATTSALLYTAPAGTVTSTQITTYFSIGSAVAANLTSVRVTNTDGQYGTLANAYKITV
jgi:hypothetical protein